MTGFRPGGNHALAVLALLVAAMATPAHSKDFALVSSKTGGIGAITMADLVKVCKGQTLRWPDGKPVSLIMREPGAADMKVVVERIYGLSPQELRDLIAAANHGRSERPAIIVANSDEDVIHWVKSSPGAVGLVDVYSITGAVNVVKIGGKLPLETGYPLHGN